MRSRITITISEDLLAKVDTVIDGNTIRNRSQAIETILRQVVKPKIDTAVILAGGPGTKLPSFKGKPAALIPMKDTPLIELAISHLKKFGYTKVIIAMNAKDKEIKEILGDGSRFGLTILYSEETTPLGTGGALKKLEKMVSKQPFLLLHTDVLTNINLNEFADYFTDSGKKAAMAIKPRPGKISYGRVYLEGNKIIDFKQPKEQSEVGLINTGIYLLDHTCFKALPKEKNFRLEDTLIPKLVSTNQITAYTFQGIWFDVTDPDDYQEAVSRLDDLKS